MNTSKKQQQPASLSLATQLTQIGQNQNSPVGALATPIWRASTIVFPDYDAYAAAERGQAGEGVSYGLHGLPTVQDLQKALAQLEGAYAGLVVPSGLTATTLPLIALLSAGDHLLMVDSAYSPTRRFCENTLKRLGIEVTYYDPVCGAAIEQLLRPNTKVVFLESPGSLTFEMQDIPAITAVCQRYKVITVLDNTWATPLGFRAFDHGVDVSVHALTKFVGGHSDLLMGLINCNAATYPQIKRQWLDLGVTPSPDDCFLALRGLRTLAMRLAQHEKNGKEVATWLHDRPEVDKVLYPALPDAPGHEIWKRDYQLATGVFSFTLRETDPARIARLFDALQVIRMGWSWGGYISLLTLFEADKLRSATRWPYPGTALRLAVGLESPDDLIADLERGFAAMAF